VDKVAEPVGNTDDFNGFGLGEVAEPKAKLKNKT
jgi:hypothetical protein